MFLSSVIQLSKLQAAVLPFILGRKWFRSAHYGAIWGLGIYIYIYIHIYIYIYIHIDIHINTHTYIYIYI
jgi:hypothetical protein